MDRDCCLAADTKTKLDSYLAVRTKLQEIVRERRKDTERYGKELFLADRQKQSYDKLP